MKDKVPKQLEDLKALRKAGASDETTALLRKALRVRVNVVVAKAAQIAGELNIQSLLPDLCQAFERLFTNPAQNDPQCLGKNAIAKTLKDLGLSESALFLRGLKHVQFEPVWGGQQDTAAVLRGTCAMALVQCTDLLRHETLLHLVEALSEDSVTVRLDAARALEQMSGPEAILLLRLKACLRDKDARVTGQSLEAILHLEERHAVPFVAEFLKTGAEEDREEAAFALGSSHLPEALSVLQQTWCDAQRPLSSPALLRAIAISRHENALDFLLHLVRTARERDAQDALHALAVHRDSPEIANRVRLSVTERKDESLTALFEENLPRLARMTTRPRLLPRHASTLSRGTASDCRLSLHRP